MGEAMSFALIRAWLVGGRDDTNPAGGTEMGHAGGEIQCTRLQGQQHSEFIGYMRWCSSTDTLRPSTIINLVDLWVDGENWVDE
jgi:hypothetical protein